MGGRRFVEGLYQALFSFRHARQTECYLQSKTKIEPDLDVTGDQSGKQKVTLNFCVTGESSLLRLRKNLMTALTFCRVHYQTILDNLNSLFVIIAVAF